MSRINDIIALAADRDWQKIPRLARRFPNVRDYIQNQIEIAQIFDHKNAVSELPMVEVDPDEQQMLLSAEKTYTANPNLAATYHSAEAFGRHCLKTHREGRRP